MWPWHVNGISDQVFKNQPYQYTRHCIYIMKNILDCISSAEPQQKICICLGECVCLHVCVHVCVCVCVHMHAYRLL